MGKYSNSKNPYWRAVDRQLTAAHYAANVDELIEGINANRAPVNPGNQAEPIEDAFFEGSGGNTQLLEVLPNSWTYYFIEGEYYWTARDTEGNWVTYIEGDIIRGIPEYLKARLEENEGIHV